MQKIIGLLALTFISSLSFAGDCTTAYLHQEQKLYEPMAHKALDGILKIIDVDTTKEPFSAAVATTTPAPEVPLDRAGNPEGATVLLSYVINTDGKAETPIILNTTQPKHSRLAIAALFKWRFTPAKLDQQNVCMVQVQEFNF